MKISRFHRGPTLPINCKFHKEGCEILLCNKQKLLQHEDICNFSLKNRLLRRSTDQHQCVSCLELFENMDNWLSHQVSAHGGPLKLHSKITQTDIKEQEISTPPHKGLIKMALKMRDAFIQDLTCHRCKTPPTLNNFERYRCTGLLSLRHPICKKCSIACPKCPCGNNISPDICYITNRLFWALGLISTLTVVFSEGTQVPATITAE